MPFQTVDIFSDQESHVDQGWSLCHVAGYTQTCCQWNHDVIDGPREVLCWDAKPSSPTDFGSAWWLCFNRYKPTIQKLVGDLNSHWIVTIQLLDIQLFSDSIQLYLVGDLNPTEKYESPFGWLFPTEWENKNVPNHQPEKGMNIPSPWAIPFPHIKHPKTPW